MSPTTAVCLLIASHLAAGVWLVSQFVHGPVAPAGARSWTVVVLMALLWPVVGAIGVIAPDAGARWLLRALGH